MGELSGTHGLDCNTCKKDPILHAARGCGTPPTYALDPYAEQSEFFTWQSDQWIMDSLEAGHPITAEIASLSYQFAGLGGVLGLTGDLWPWCPAWFSPLRGFVPDWHEREMEAAWRLAVLSKRRILSWVSPLPPTERQADELLDMLTLIQHVQNVIDERDFEKRRRDQAEAAARAAAGGK